MGTRRIKNRGEQSTVIQHDRAIRIATRDERAEMSLIDRAYQVTMESIQRAKELGVKVDITKSQAKDNGTPSSLPVEKWVHVTFHVVSEAQANLIHAMSLELSSIGIGFDQMGGGGERVWDLDWSFSLDSTKGIERHDSIIDLEQLIRRLELIGKKSH